MLFLTLGADMARSRTGGKTVATKTRKASSIKGRKPAKTKRRIAPTAIRLKRAAITGFGKELKEAREQQAATAKILKVIASSPGDVQPVLEAVAEQTNRLVGGLTTVVWRILDDVAHLAAFTKADPAADAALKAAAFRIPLSSWQVGETIRKGEVFSVADTERDVRSLRDLARLRGFRSVLYVPMLRNHEPIGIIGVTRAKPGRFAGHHVQLLQTFADQAVIAIGNARLFDEVQAKSRDLEESLQHQMATADVLKVISRSTFDLQKVLDTLTESASRLCDAFDAVLLLREGDFLRIASHYGEIPVVDKWPVCRDWISGRAAVDRKPVHVHDLLAEEAEYPMAHAFAQRTGHRTTFAVPLMRQDEAIGAISIRRMEVRPFTEKQIELMQTFADQAVIAIENARLFNETKEALAHQTATSEVLQTIGSSMADAQPVFERILDITHSLVGIEELGILLAPGDGLLHMAAHRGTRQEAFKNVFPMPIEQTASRWSNSGNGIMPTH